MKIAIYPGSFDPIQNGHLDIIKKASKKFDKVIVVLSINPDKTYMFNDDTRLAMVKEAIKDIPNVSAILNSGLTVECAKKLNAKVMIRSIRNKADRIYEKYLKNENKKLDKSIKTIFIKPDKKLKGLSSTEVKEMIKHNKDYSSSVPKEIIDIIKKCVE